MAKSPERYVIDPNIWLARSDLHRDAFETPFIESATKAVGRSFSDFKRRHLARNKPTGEVTTSETLLRKRADQIARAFFLASILILLFDSPHPPTKENLPNGSSKWVDVTLPWKISDVWTVDQNWVDINCNPNREWQGTGIPISPPLRITRKVDKNLYFQIPSPFNVYQNVLDNKGLAKSICRVFPIQPIP